MKKKTHLCDINIRVYLEQKQWDCWLTGDVEVSYADARFSHIELMSDDVFSHANMDTETLASLLNDRLIGMLVRLGATMREEFIKGIVK